MIAPEQGYRRLIDGSISYFKGPAEASVDAVMFFNLPYSSFKDIVFMDITDSIDGIIICIIMYGTDPTIICTNVLEFSFSLSCLLFRIVNNMIT